MADETLLNDVAEFLRDVVPDLTNMHVKAAQYQNSASPPSTITAVDGVDDAEVAALVREWVAGRRDDQAAVDALAALPAGLIDRAQSLTARIEKAGEPKAAAKSKPASR